jgi:NADPH:quinone reductase-like Zn-dependent oxidoreductase
MNELFEVGEVKPVVDRCYPLVEVPDAFRYYATGSAKGKVVVSMDRPP